MRYNQRTSADESYGLARVRRPARSDYIDKMAMFGTVGEFVEENSDWLEHTELLEHFFTANEITDEDNTPSC